MTIKEYAPPVVSATVGQPEGRMNLDSSPAIISHVVNTQQSATLPSMGAAALRLAQRGLAVLPLRAGGKEPATKNGFRDATTDTARIMAWWKKTPNANVGVYPGSAGIVVLDFDEYKPDYQGADLLERLLTDHPTVCDISGGGGRRLWYCAPVGERFTNATGNLPKGIDVRSDGGYIAVAPSIHPNGKRYEWVEGMGPDERPLAELPHFLADLLCRTNAASSACRATFSGEDAPIPDLAALDLSETTLANISTSARKGQRSEVDFAVVCNLVRAGLNDDQIRAIWRTYPIGTQGKYSDRGQGDRYLARTIGKVRAKVVEASLSAAAASAMLPRHPNGRDGRAATRRGRATCAGLHQDLGRHRRHGGATPVLDSGCRPAGHRRMGERQ